MQGIKVTLETLYDILRNEKKREDLQKLDDSFFVDIVSYVREKKTILESKKDEEELFAAGEKKNLQYELRSIKRILKEIYEKREKKIIEIALNKSRTGSDIIDTSSMLREEKEFYGKLLANLDLYRRGILLNLFKGELPNVSEDNKRIDIKPKPEEKKGMTKVRLVNPVPSFVWKDLKVYGPYDKGEEIEIFPEVASLLVRKGRAEFV